MPMRLVRHCSHPHQRLHKIDEEEVDNLFRLQSNAIHEMRVQTTTQKHNMSTSLLYRLRHIVQRPSLL